jgi:hypothetical protein
MEAPVLRGRRSDEYRDELNEHASCQFGAVQQIRKEGDLQVDASSLRRNFSRYAAASHKNFSSSLVQLPRMERICEGQIEFSTQNFQELMGRRAPPRGPPRSPKRCVDRLLGPSTRPLHTSRAAHSPPLAMHERVGGFEGVQRGWAGPARPHWREGLSAERLTEQLAELSPDKSMVTQRRPKHLELHPARLGCLRAPHPSLFQQMCVGCA